MASTTVQNAIQSWKKFNLSDLQKELDERATEIADQQDKSDSSRKKLIDLSKEFRKNTPEDVRKMVAPLLKNFQQEVDTLYKRCKSSEVAFLAVYKRVLDICDPIPALEHYVSLQQKAAKFTDLEIEAKQLRATLKDYNQEFKEVRNQEVTIKQLKERIRGFEESLDKKVEEQTKSVEKEMFLQFSTKEKHLEEEIVTLKKKLYETKLRSTSLQTALSNTQSELFELKTNAEENVSARSDEVEILMNDVDKGNQRALMAEKELAEIKEQLTMAKEAEETSTSSETQQAVDLSKSPAAFDLASKEREISQLVVDLQKLQSAFNKQRQEGEKSINRLSLTCDEQAATIKSFEGTLKERENYEEIRRELEILKLMEFSCKQEDAGSLNSKPLEVLLLEKNKQLKSENTTLRIANEDLNTKHKELSRDYLGTVNTVGDQQRLIKQLESDVSNIHMVSSMFRGEGEGQASPMLSSELVAEAVKDSSAIPTTEQSNAAESLLPIVTSQRERFRQRNEELETHSNMQQQQITALQSEVGQLRGDNIKLYEKIKFLQSYSAQRSAQPDDMETRYSSQYEAKLDPFSSFSSRERQRKYTNLSPFEKITLGMGRAILSNKIARMFAFIYTILMHTLIFLVLYKLANTESCKRDFSSEWHAKYAEHMHQVHGEALDHFHGNG